MKPPLHPTVLRHLQAVQRSTAVGVHRFCRLGSVGARSASTVYRWQRSVADGLLVVPNVSVEALGLRHAHVFASAPVVTPFGVEAAWVTRDFCTETFYVHCLVPAGHEAAFLQGLGRATVVWSSSGWQQFLHDDAPIQLPIPVDPVSDSVLLRRSPFLVAAIAELWQYPNTLPVVWHRLHQRLGSRVRLFLPRTKIRYVNGKTHVTDAFLLLQREGLVRQHLIRYHPLLAVSVEVFVLLRLERDDAVVVLEELRRDLHAVESYPTSDGYWVRLLGPHRLLDRIITLPSSVRSRLTLLFFHTKRLPAPLVRFSYETVLDPTTSAWTVTA